MKFPAMIAALAVLTACAPPAPDEQYQGAARVCRAGEMIFAPWNAMLVLHRDEDGTPTAMAGFSPTTYNDTWIMTDAPTVQEQESGDLSVAGALDTGDASPITFQIKAAPKDATYAGEVDFLSNDTHVVCSEYLVTREE